MTLLAWLGASLLLLGCAHWLMIAVLAARTIRQMPVLSGLHAPEPPRWPRVSVVIPACNEADTLEAAMMAKLAEGYPDIEFILVDDRSSDDTPAIVDRLAARDPRIRALHVRELPAGWLGKVHALQRGVDAATGEWILFSDADVHFAAGALQRAVAYALARELDHLTVLPHFLPGTFALNVTMSYFPRLGCAAAQVSSVEDPRSPVAIGAGVFNLVRRAALERTPGLSWLKLEVGDDVALGYLLKRHGARLSVVNGRDQVMVQFYRTLPEMIRGAEKNSFAVAGQYRVGQVLAVASGMVFIELAPLLAALFGPAAWVRAVGAGTFAVGLLTSVALARWAGLRPLPALLGVFAAPIYAYMTLRAAWLTLRNGGITWRGTLYPLAELRAAQRVNYIWPWRHPRPDA